MTDFDAEVQEKLRAQIRKQNENIRRAQERLSRTPDEVAELRRQWRAGRPITEESP